MTDLVPRLEAVAVAPAAQPVAEAAVEAAPERLTGAERGWMRRYRRMLVAVDVIAIVLGVVAAWGVRFDFHRGYAVPLLVAVALAVGMGWLVLLQGCGSYELRRLGSGVNEAKLVLRAAAMTIGVLAVYCYATKTGIARGFVVIAIPVGTGLQLLGRTFVRRYARRHRQHGQWSHRILAVGTSDSVRHLYETTKHAYGSGLVIVGACVQDAEIGTELSPGVPVIGGVREAAAAADQLDADVVAVTGEGLGPTGVRELGWNLEGTGRGLVMAPALTEIAGTRVHVSPVNGLPLVWLEQPQLGRVPRAIKRTMDVVLGSLGLLLAAPILLLAALAIKLTSQGPVFYRQRRLGIRGSEFAILKLRTMCVDADKQKDLLIGLNEQDGGGVLFKIRRDPRVTRVGRWLRTFSIDELPQLVHVVSGKMSLVGPRPLAAEDSTYEGHHLRRLLVRPGITGIWQVSGRSDLSWNDAVRMDLYYVENWSILFDLSLLARTFLAVLSRRGAV